VGKVKEIIERNRSLKEAIFTSEELHDSFGWRDPYVHLAACFTAKEALFKALGTGLSGRMDWRDVEVFGGNPVRPMLLLSGATARVAEEQGMVSCILSLTHTRRLAAALILLVLEISKQKVDSSITL
jgi:holo-[acyl-carrier protein] synthase